MRRNPVTLQSREQAAFCRRLKFHLKLLAIVESKDDDALRRDYMAGCLAAERKLTERAIKRLSA